MLAKKLEFLSEITQTIVSAALLEFSQSLKSPIRAHIILSSVVYLEVVS